MRASTGAFAFALLLTSGCAGGAAGVPATGSAAATEAVGPGTILGLVINTEAAPVGSAIVVVDGLEPVVTTEAGSFEVRGLSAGSHRVEVQALGYESVARNVDVSEHEATRVTITLNPVPVIEPYIELLIFKGFSQCDYSVWVVSGRLGPPCDTGQARSQFKVRVNETWEFHVTEMKWTGGFGGYDSFRLFTSNDGDCASGSPCYGLVYGEGYARLEGEPGKTELVRFYDPWLDERGPPYPENSSFDMVVNGQWIGALQRELNQPTLCQTVLTVGTGSGNKPGCLGVGVATGIPYDLYVSIFHSMQPEDRGPCCPATKYTALPDH